MSSSPEYVAVTTEAFEIIQALAVNPLIATEAIMVTLGNKYEKDYQDLLLFEPNYSGTVIEILCLAFSYQVLNWSNLYQRITEARFLESEITTNQPATLSAEITQEADKGAILAALEDQPELLQIVDRLPAVTGTD